MLKQKIFYILITAILIYGCKKDPNSPEPTPTQYGAYVLNEGNFGQSNGSISFFNLEKKEIENHIFEKVNGENPGDVVQSMTIIGDNGYIVVNGSDKIEVISMKTWKKVKTINSPAGSSPRHLLPVSETKAYITNLYTASVSVLNLETDEITSSINVGLNPDEMTSSGNKVFVANNGFGNDHTVSVIDITTDQVIKTIDVADNPTATFTDNNGDIHVLCTGRYPAWDNPDDTGSKGGIYLIDASTETVKDSLSLTGFPTRLVYDGETTGYFLRGSAVTSYSTETVDIITDTLVSGNFYSLSVHPESGDLYLFDALDYSQNGLLKIYSAEGIFQDSYETGIIPHKAIFLLSE
ncbi:MAG: YncE family protein [Calditrichaceae bacterium]|nr:YncE family protein [Calditrichaceae bacterium]